MTADHMYSCHNGEQFTQQVPTQLSSKPKTLLISKKVVTWTTESPCFRTPFRSECVKGP